MLYKLQSFQSLWRKISLSAAFPYISLLIWTFPLLLFTSGQNSLIAHDEALYARRARLIVDTGDWIAGWGTNHHKTPGPYWLIASFYQLFGINEFSVRLPSLIFGIFCLFLVYEIGKIILNKNLAWLGAAILSVEFLWLQYCRIGNPDIPMVFLVLLAIYSLIKAELKPKYNYIYGFIAGLTLGLGFLMRSFVIALPTIALLPYLIVGNRRHRHLFNPWLYAGIIIGFIPTLAWSWLSWQLDSNNTLTPLVGFVLQSSAEERDGNGILFYFWNIALKAFPWTLFGLLGLFLLCRNPLPRYNLILLGFPLILFTELTIFSTRLSHYALCLYPFIALLAAVGLDWLGKIFEQGYTKSKSLWKKSNVLLILSYGCGGLGILFLIAAIVAFIWGGSYRNYAIIGLVVGLSWFIVPIVWMSRHRFGLKSFTSNYWIAGWLIPCWLAFALAGSFGLLSDYNPAYRIFLQKPAIASILKNHPIHFVKLEGKKSVLILFYTPIHGKEVEKIAQLPPSSYAWIDKNSTPEIPQPHRLIGEVQNYQLVQLLP
jgi:4-amino-4-deoxy-L-arabinose transferase-like glycosyltransferase